MSAACKPDKGLYGCLGATKLFPVKDTFLTAAFPTSTHGYDPYLACGSAGLLSNGMPSLFQFDLTKVPAGVTILSAQLHFYGTNYNSGCSPPPLCTYHVFALLHPWNEYLATWKTYDGVNSWGSEGAEGLALDREAAQSGDIVGPLAYTWNSVDVSGLVSRWHKGTLVNHGMKLQQVSGTQNIGVSSRESPTSKPYLSVQFTKP